MMTTMDNVQPSVYGIVFAASGPRHWHVNQLAIALASWTRCRCVYVGKACVKKA